MMMRSTLSLFAGFAVVLAAIAIVSPEPPRVTDRDVYEATAARIIVRDCSDLHCFRVLVPWVLGRLPGPSLLRWRAYAVICNAAAAAMVFPMCLALGVRHRAAVMASAMSALGFGSLYTLHDSYTADPLMFAIGPVATLELIRGRLAVGAAIGSVGVLAKEFAAAPLYLVAGMGAIERDWVAMLRNLVAANTAFIVWVAFTMTMILAFNYSWGGTESANLSQGAAIGPWLQRQSLRGIASAMFNEFGALWLLMPVGALVAPPRLRHLAVAALPIAAVFAYIQQPDRALWNFHFVFVPLAAVVLAAVPTTLAWGTIVTFGIGNLRVAAQLPISTAARLAVASSVLLALSALVSFRFMRADVPYAPGVSRVHAS